MRQSSKVSIAFAGGILLYFIASLLLGLLPEGTALPVYLNLILSQSLIILPAVLYLKTTGKDVRSITKGSRLSGWAVLCLVIFIFVAEPLIIFLNYVSSLVFGNAVAGLSEEMLNLPTLTNVLFIAVLPAFVEEFVFRGVYYQGLRKHGFWKTAFITGLFFGLMHMNWNQFSYGFVLGILFAFLIEATGNIRASIIVHFGINFESVMALNTLKTLLSNDEVKEMLETSEQTLEFGMMEGAELLYGSYLFLAAAISLALCILLIWLAAKASQRTGYMGWILWGGERKHLQNVTKEPLFDRYMFAAILLPAGLMTLFYFL